MWNEHRPFMQVVDGHELPVFIAGYPALELCNSYAGWNDSREHDYLTTFDHLATLARESGALGVGAAAAAMAAARHDPEAAVAALERARRLRSALYAICTRQPDDASWALVAHEVQAAHALLELTRGSPARLELDLGAGAGLPVAAMALAAADLLTRVPLSTVSACPGRGCGWLFADPSGRRRWCIMAVCGNREKARRHAARRRR